MVDGTRLELATAPHLRASGLRFGCRFSQRSVVVQANLQPRRGAFVLGDRAGVVGGFLKRPNDRDVFPPRTRPDGVHGPTDEIAAVNLGNRNVARAAAGIAVCARHGLGHD